MSLNIKALTIVGAVMLGGCCFLVGLTNLIWESYGAGFLDVVASLYPGYHGPTGFGSVIVVTLYGAVDGAVCGAIVGWVYNAVAGGGSRAAA
ncbi:MAG: membrane-associated protein [Gemmatimonadota bacterium]|nr:membrane-associated protein [Gemmatimonadota bacterium]MDH3479772.1 membrane-associated protein [Gemmatimonadota bacterium]MDH3570143.1 membrane-associated protein [Gemmatimonadota bacterium]MDH5549791.1 membrane-associated protein [Gemmatimonadota bacterium]